MGMSRYTIGLSVLAFFALLSVGGCTTAAQVGNYDESLTEDYIPLEEEQWAKEQAYIFHGEFVEQGLLYSDTNVRLYMNYLEQRLLFGREDLQGAIALFVIKSPVPNAFVMPNGYVYINSGLFCNLETEDQLAAIISHEIAHVTQMHSVKSVIARKNTLIGAHVGDFMTGGLGLVYFGAFANIMHFSREQEREADEVGLAILSDSGYQPKAMLEAFQSMNKSPELRHSKQSIYSSHPSTDSRINELKTMVNSLPQTELSGEVVSEYFVSIKARMMEDSLKIRLRNREYNLGLSIINEASRYFSDSAKTYFYLGEVHRGFYRYPKDAARELYWINIGQAKVDEALQKRFENERSTNFSESIRFYELAAASDPPYAKAFRRLGEMAQESGQYDKARQYYIRYMQLSPNSSDKLYIERALKNIDMEPKRGK